MAHWARSLDGDCWHNLDRWDSIGVMGTGDRWLVIAERHDRPNVTLGSYASKDVALAQAAQLIGEQS